MLGLLRQRVEQVIDECASPRVRGEIVALLRRPGYALDSESSCRAGMLALCVHEAVSRDPGADAALLAAVALELQMEAAFVFDDVADEAAYETRTEDLPLAIALMTTGMAAAQKAASGAPDPADALQHFCRSYGEACEGQFLDAMLQRRGAITLEEALEATRLKSGGLGRFVTGFASRVGGAGAEGIALFERLGVDAFTFAQIVDDLRDACAGGDDSDLAQGRATLPVAFSARNRGDEGAMIPPGVPAYASSGAPVYAAIVAQAYMKRAEDDLALLARQGYAIGGLVRYLKSLDSAAGDALAAARVGLVP